MVRQSSLERILFFFGREGYNAPGLRKDIILFGWEGYDAPGLREDIYLRTLVFCPRI